MTDGGAPRLAHALMVAAWLTLAGALGELVVLAVMKQGSPMFRLSGDFPWMAPVTLAAIVWAAVLPWLALAAAGAVRPAVAGLLASASFVVALNSLMLVRGLSHYAAALIALGASVQGARVLVRRLPGAAARARRSLPILAALLLLTAIALRATSAGPGTAGSQPAPADGPTPPNVLLITLDTVRALSLSLYGYERNTTSQLAQFASRGVVFNRAFATAPWTLPSHASLFTGRWAHELSTGYETPLDATFPTLAEYLAGRGYRTGGFAANLGYVGRDTGLARGFAHYEDYQRSLGELASSSTLLRRVTSNFRLRALIENDEHINRIGAADLSSRALAWIDEAPGTPFFAFLNYFDAHEPYLPPPPFDTQFGPGRARGRRSPLHRWLWDVTVDHREMTTAELREERDAYDGALAHLDREVGALIAELDRRGVLRHTVVVVTSDHGEEFGEHGVFEHGYSLYRPALQVPLIIAAPALTTAVRVDSPVSLRDVAATVVDLAGHAQGAPFPGRSLARYWSGAPPADGAPLLSEVGYARGQPEWFPASRGDMISAVHGGVHCIRRGDGHEELYDLADVWERDDLAARSEYADRGRACRQARDSAGGAAHH